MHKTLFAAACALMVAVAATPSPLLAQALVNGQVTKVDQAAEKITIRHEAIKKFDMDGMTMVFRVQDAAMLRQVKAGDKIKFDLERINGQFAVTKIEKAK